ncbi:MAG: SCP2 sterol-binding domain-containing protein [Burkholderiales bacterium]|nr:SCP2 sterol-binding domain-containing protein [Burkholderiales bacterium]
MSVPAPVAALIARLPALPPSMVAAAVLNRVAARYADPQSLAPLEGKAVRVTVLDAGLAITVRCTGGRFVATGRGVVPAATIAAALADFMALAARREDPDTLFFARRLTLEGDTEASLAMRNLLDRVDVAPVAAWFTRIAARR